MVSKNIKVSEFNIFTFIMEESKLLELLVEMKTKVATYKIKKADHISK